MARAIKKVKNDKKKLTYKFWIIISCVAVALIAGFITLGLSLYVINNTSDINNLFSEYTEYKVNYIEIPEILTGEYTTSEYDEYEEAFIIVYDNSLEFDDDEDLATDKTNLARKTAIENIAKIKKAIDDYNATEGIPYKIAFFMINTSLTGNESATTLNGGSDEESTYASPSIIHIHGEEYKDTYEYNDITYTLSGGNGSLQDFNNVVTEACGYLGTLKKDLES